MEEKDDFWGDIGKAQEETIPSVMISGEPQPVHVPQEMYGSQHQMILMQQPSAAPKVIGIFVIIYGAINALGGLLGVFGGALLESEIDTGGSTIFVIGFSLVSLVVGICFIIAGSQINQRRKIGIQISWILILVSLVLGVAQTLLMPADLGAAALNEDVYYGIQIGGQVVCNTICGLLVAIPLMVNNSMMDDSSVWG
jgi:hypothetical protein